MAENFASSFVDTFGAMQNQKRANAELNMAQLKQLADQHYQQAHLDLQQQEQDLNQKKFDWQKDPNSPPNIQAAARAKHEETLADRYAAIAEINADREKRLLDADTAKRYQKASMALRDSKNPARNALEAAAAGPLTPDEMKHWLETYELPQLAREHMKAANQAAGQSADEINALLSGPAQQPEQNAPGQAAAGIFGGVAPAGVPAPAPQQPTELGQALGGIGEILNRNAANVPPAPTTEDAALADNPVWLAKERKLAGDEKLQQSKIALQTSQAARADVLAKLAPQRLTQLIQHQKEVNDYRQKQYQRGLSNDVQRKFYQNGMLDVSRLNAAANWNRSVASSDIETRQAIKDADAARSVAKMELGITDHEIGKLDEQARDLAQETLQLEKMMPQKLPNGKYPGQSTSGFLGFGEGESDYDYLNKHTAPGGKMTLLQLQSLIDANKGTQADLDSRRQKLVKDKTRLNGLATQTGVDGGFLSRSGKPQAPPPKPLFGNPIVPGSGAGIPTLTPAQAQMLPKGTHFRGTNGKEYVVR